MSDQDSKSRWESIAAELGIPSATDPKKSDELNDPVPPSSSTVGADASAESVASPEPEPVRDAVSNDEPPVAEVVEAGVETERTEEVGAEREGAVEEKEERDKTRRRRRRSSKRKRSPEEGEEAPAPEADQGDEDQPPRRKRSRGRNRKKQAAGENGDAAESEEKAPRRRRRKEGGERVEDEEVVVETRTDDEDDDVVEPDDYSDWNVPHWHEIIAGLYRPDR